MKEHAERVAKRLGVEQTDSGLALTKESLLAAIGGPLGVLESVLPAFSFSLVYASTKSALWSVSVSGALAILFIGIRLFRRQSITQAVAGALAIALAAFLALREGGRAQDYFVPGFITNASYGFALLVSVLIRYPVMGFVAQYLFGVADWRRRVTVYKRVRLVTLIWVGFFGLRLLVQLPLYFSEQVELLAASKVVMGAPAYAGLLALTWVLLKRIGETEKQ